jgi:phospholipid/cholesterol/gamma-HCH transport system substrate-binding protein
MRRAQYISWSELRVGLLVIASFTILGLTILYIGSQQGIFAETYLLKVYMARVNGLQTGAPVWLSGMRVGSVREIRFLDRVELTDIEVSLEIDRRVSERIRKDSVARIGTLGLLGDKYVSITQGSIDEPAVPEGGILRGANPVDFEELIADASRAVDDLVITLENTRDISEKINSGTGVLGRLVNDPELLEEARALIRDTRSLLDRAQNGDGTMARLLNDDALYGGLSRLFWSSDTLMTQIRAGDGTLGRLIYDPALYDNLTSLTARFDSLLARVESGEGTAGRLLQDEALYEELKAVSESTRELVEDIKRNPARYINIRIF